MSRVRLHRARVFGASGSNAGKRRSRASAAMATTDILVEDRATYSSSMLRSDGIQTSLTPVPVRSSHRIEWRQTPAPSEATAASPICGGEDGAKPDEDNSRKFSAFR